MHSKPVYIFLYLFGYYETKSGAELTLKMHFMHTKINWHDATLAHKNNARYFVLKSRAAGAKQNYISKD